MKWKNQLVRCPTMILPSSDRANPTTKAAGVYCLDCAEARPALEGDTSSAAALLPKSVTINTVVLLNARYGFGSNPISFIVQLYEPRMKFGSHADSAAQNMSP